MIISPFADGQQPGRLKAAEDSDSNKSRTPTELTAQAPSRRRG